MLTIYIHRALIIIGIVFLGMAIALPLQAHGVHHLYYVATTGHDDGNCDTLIHPCRSIQYALVRVESSASNDAEIRISAGDYELSDADVLRLSNSLITVRASFSDAYNIVDDGLFTSFAYGPSAIYRDQLVNWGLVLMDMKGAARPIETNAKLTDATQIAQVGAVVPCTNGFALGLYACDGVDLLSHLPFTSFRSNPSRMANIWGFVSKNDAREYVLVGLNNGTAVLDVTDPLNPREITTIPAASNSWREMRTYQVWSAADQRWNAYAYVVTESWGQGLQIIELSHLPITATLAATQTNILKAHTVYVGDVDYIYGVSNTGGPAYLYLNGTNLDRGAFHILDLSNPISPSKISTPTLNANYTHDGVGFVITDTRTAECANGHNPCELYVDFNQTKVDLFDVTDKTAPTLLSSITYSEARYVHSGWWTADKRYVTVHDERDEYDLGISMTVRALDLNSLRAPSIITIFRGNTSAIDHNGYVVNERYYQSSYQRGLMIFDISNPRAMREIAGFDTYPISDNARYNGAWGTYPFFPSRNIAVGDMENGLFMLREAKPQSTLTPTAMSTPISPFTGTTSPTATSTSSTTPTPSATTTATPAPTTTSTLTLTPTSTPTVSAKVNRIFLSLVMVRIQGRCMVSVDYSPALSMAAACF